MGLLSFATRGEEGDKWVAAANNAFAVELYAKLSPQAGNLFFSPNSLETALAMTYAGARGQTAAQMSAVLHLPQKGDALHQDLAALISELNGKGKRSFELSVANALWGHKGYAFQPAFLKLVKDNYGAGLEDVDFANEPAARATINGWVEKQTHEKIKDLIPVGILNDLTRLVLTNAIYFKGTWEDQFEKKATRDQPFHISAAEQVNCSLMTRKGKYAYSESDKFQAVQLPYKGRELSMIVLLPRAVDGLPDLERELTAENAAKWLGELKQNDVIVSLPRFKVEAQFSLAPVLQSLGMKDAFSAADADFSGMTGNRDLFITAVLHKAFVDVNEEGTEAAAASAVVMGLRGMPPREPQPKIFRADHPFIFLIRHEQSGAILFLGRLAKP
jgi:serpin B